MLLSPVRMHIPDGLLSIAVSLLTWAVTILALGFALKRVGKDLSERQIPMMGVMGAIIFAAQMINFPVASGTSGHLLAMQLIGRMKRCLQLTAWISLCRAERSSVFAANSLFRVVWTVTVE